MIYSTMPMPNRYRMREGHLGHAQERVREMMRDEYPDNGEAVGVCICPISWDLVLVWKAP